MDFIYKLSDCVHGERIHGVSPTTLGLPAVARAAGRSDDGEVLRELGQVTAASQAIAAMGLRATLRRVSGLRPGAEASVLKVAGGWHNTTIAETALR
jgi:hypothetical protein